jgi:uncharacterized OB-fold protein
MDNNFDIEPDDIEESEPSEYQKKAATFTDDFLNPKSESVRCFDCTHFDYYPHKHCKKTGAEVVDEMAEVDCDDFERYEE